MNQADWSAVVPVKNEVRELAESLPNAIRLRPNEIVLVVDDKPESEPIIVLA